MNRTTVAAEGYATLDKEAVRHLGVKPGDQIEVNKMPNGRLEIRAARKKHHISKVFGMLHRPDAPVLSIEAINEIAAKGWAGEL